MNDSSPNFASLRRSGLNYVQKASGEIWTDYNLHDPGITILEQFCFALTEISFRADNSVKHLLSDENGDFEYSIAGLTDSSKAFLQKPTTLEDLENIISKMGNSYKNVFLYPSQINQHAGLYDVFVVPKLSADQESPICDPDMENEARSVFMQNRNLCEDVLNISVAKKLPCKLKAQIEVGRTNSPEHYAAQIYAKCFRLMAGQFHIPRSESRMPESDQDTDTTSSQKSAETKNPDMSLGLFFSKLAEADGIGVVKSLSFELMDNPAIDPFIAAETPGSYLDLHIPETLEDVDLKLTSQGMDIVLDEERMNEELSRLLTIYLNDDAMSVQDHGIADQQKRPKSRAKREFRYSLLGENLPPAYATQSELLPDSISIKYRAHVNQLKGLLSLSDSMLQNANADISGLSHLFSNSHTHQNSYSTESVDALDNENEVISLKSELKRFDPWVERKGRIFDYLLGLQGQKFSHNSLSRHDCYRNRYDQQIALLNNRSLLLKEIDSINYNRFAAPNILKDEHGHEVGIGRKLAILLDFPDRKEFARLSEAFDCYGLGFTSDKLPIKDKSKTVLGSTNPLDMIPDRSHNDDIEEISEYFAQELIEKTRFLNKCLVNDQMLRRGIEYDAYILNKRSNGRWKLFFDCGAEEGVFNCATFSGREAAIKHANQLRKFFVTLNQQSEGFYVIEDIMLRSHGLKVNPLTVTLVFSGWSARTQSSRTINADPNEQSDFRKLVTETARIVCPAHIHVNVVWLDYHDMGWFEELYFDWHQTYKKNFETGDEESGSDLSECAKKLRYFLDDLDREPCP